MEESNRDHAWEAELVTRGEMMELMVPIIQSLSNLAKSHSALGRACIDSSDPSLVRAGFAAMDGAKESRDDLEEFREVFERVLAEHGLESGGEDAGS
ncbi:hypothetical protein [Halomonas sp. S2151]|uniref:hypothetical protein n=1 Tax=Halomonas sp. S2151 TaxID=579478 RepID=UPI000B0B32BC|nr:hypothetical protein [Halomonas sp. S2151]